MELMTALTWLVYVLLGLSAFGALVVVGFFTFLGYMAWKQFKDFRR